MIQKDVMHEYTLYMNPVSLQLSLFFLVGSNPNVGAFVDRLGTAMDAENIPQSLYEW